MNCIIVDDDLLSRNLIEAYIERTNTLFLKGSFSNPIEALTLLKSENSVDLLFLDILMPEMNGFQILDILDGRQQIIIISGKKEFALETFKYDVTDYLLKPITYERFFKAVGKAYERNRELYPKKNADNFLVKKGLSYQRVYYTDILFIEAENENVFLHTFEDKFNIISNLDDIESFLPNDKFVRIHDKFVVNINKVDSVDKNNVSLLLKNSKKTIPIDFGFSNIISDKIRLSKAI